MRIVGLIILIAVQIFYLIFPVLLWKRLSALSKTREDIPEEFKLFYGCLWLASIGCLVFSILFSDVDLGSFLHLLGVIISSWGIGYAFEEFSREKKRIKEILKLKEQSNSETEK